MSRVVYLPTLCGEGNPFWVRYFVYINGPTVADLRSAPPRTNYFFNGFPLRDWRPLLKEILDLPLVNQCHTPSRFIQNLADKFFKLMKS